MDVLPAEKVPGVYEKLVQYALSCHVAVVDWQGAGIILLVEDLCFLRVDLEEEIQKGEEMVKDALPLAAR